MDYKTSWEDTISWLDKSIAHLEEVLNNGSLNTGDLAMYRLSHQRLSNKLDGFKTVRQHMSDSEKIYSE